MLYLLWHVKMSSMKKAYVAKLGKQGWVCVTVAIYSTSCRSLDVLNRLIRLIDVNPGVILPAFILTVSLFFSQRQRKSVWGTSEEHMMLIRWPRFCSSTTVCHCARTETELAVSMLIYIPKAMLLTGYLSGVLGHNRKSTAVSYKSSLWKKLFK